ncbi:MAG TPA: efflux RND transporter permease subunit, partial [Myxococcota bacterium]
AELISGSRADVGITLFGDDLADLERASELVQTAIKRVQGADDVRGEHLAGVATVDITVDRAKAAAAGVDSGAVLDVVDAVGGRVVAEVRRGQRVIPVQVRFKDSDRADVADLAVLPVESDGGARELGDVASIAVVDAPASINRSGLRRRTIVEVNVRDRDLAGFVVEAKGAMATLSLPPGVVVRWGGQYEQLEAARARLAVAVPLALAVIFVLLLLACGSARTAATVFLNVPLAAVGGVVALWLRGIELSVSAGVGFIAVFGVAVLNGLVLMTSIDDALRHNGADAVEGGRRPDVVAAVKAAALARLRPVVTTAAVAILGFVPMALSTSAGAEVQRPLATVVIGGLLSSTALTLLVLPAIAVWRRRPR